MADAVYYADRDAPRFLARHVRGERDTWWDPRVGAWTPTSVLREWDFLGDHDGLHVITEDEAHAIWHGHGA